MWSDVKRQHRRDRITIGCSCGCHRRDGHHDLTEIRERARRLGLKLMILSRVGTGTKAKPAIPATAAYESRCGRARYRFGRPLGKAQERAGESR